MKLLEYKQIFEGIYYHAANQIPLGELYRVGSENYYKTFREARRMLGEGKITVDGVDQFLLEQTDIGEFAEYEGATVPLDSPILAEAEHQGKKVELNKPKRGGSKKYYVYVRDPKTKNIKKIAFGDTTGLTSKINDPAARKSFVARHNCSEKKDKTKAGYWACRLPYYAKSLGLSGGGNFFW